MDLTKGTIIDHDLYGEGIVAKVNPVSYDVYFAKGGKVEILKSNKEFSIKQSGDAIQESSASIDIEALEKMFVYVLDRFGITPSNIPLANKWSGGKMILQPANTSMQNKEIPIDAFFHKIVMLRDRLRVMEQKINSNAKMSDDEKVDLQQYITRIYGSLTTFNVLFADKDNQFIGTGGAE